MISLSKFSYIACNSGEHSFNLRELHIKTSTYRGMIERPGAGEVAMSTNGIDGFETAHQ